VASSHGSLSVDDVDDDETVVRLVRLSDDDPADDVFGASAVCAAIIVVGVAVTVHGLLSTVSLTVLTVLFLNFKKANFF